MDSSEVRTIVAFDVGGRRIGVALANSIARIASPLTTLINDENIFEAMKELVAEHDASVLVVGLPRGLDGQETEQTRTVQAFAEEMKKYLNLPLYWQDEAVTSRKAEAELNARGKAFAKGDIDALAATYILEDFLREQFQEVM